MGSRKFEEEKDRMVEKMWTMNRGRARVGLPGRYIVLGRLTRLSLEFIEDWPEDSAGGLLY